MTTIPRMIVLRRQDSPVHDPQDDLTSTSGHFSARYAERSEPANRNEPSWACGATSPDNWRICWCWCEDDSHWISVQMVFEHFWTPLQALSPRLTESGH